MPLGLVVALFTRNEDIVSFRSGGGYVIYPFAHIFVKFF